MSFEYQSFDEAMSMYRARVPLLASWTAAANDSESKPYAFILNLNSELEYAVTQRLQALETIFRHIRNMNFGSSDTWSNLYERAIFTLDRPQHELAHLLLGLTLRKLGQILPYDFAYDGNRISEAIADAIEIPFKGLRMSLCAKGEDIFEKSKFILKVSEFYTREKPRAFDELKTAWQAAHDNDFPVTIFEARLFGLKTLEDDTGPKQSSGSCIKSEKLDPLGPNRWGESILIPDHIPREITDQIHEALYPVIKAFEREVLERFSKYHLSCPGRNWSQRKTLVDIMMATARVDTLAAIIDNPDMPARIQFDEGLIERFMNDGFPCHEAASPFRHPELLELSTECG